MMSVSAKKQSTDSRKNGSKRGEDLKRAGIALVAANNEDWLGNAERVVMLYAPHDREFMPDEFKHYPGIGSPKHSNAWGALTRTLKAHGFMRPTERYVKSSSAINHAHKYTTYRRIPVWRPDQPKLEEKLY